MNWQGYQRLTRRMLRIFAALELVLCSQCFRNHYGAIREEHNELRGHLKDGRPAKGLQPHHGGFSLRLLRPAQAVLSEHLEKFFTDEEHGLVHGLCTAVTGLLLDNSLLSTRSLRSFFSSAEPQIARFVCSAVLHDFVRSATGKSKGHDEALSKLFPLLLPETFRHSNPGDDEVDKLLVRSDRLELCRFSDWQAWVDARLLERAARGANPDALEIFRRIIRPALVKLARPGCLWIRHGAEFKANISGIRPPDFTDRTYPQAGTFLNVRDNIDGPPGFSVEVSTSPLSGCMGHGGQWQHLQGIISIDEYLLHGSLALCSYSGNDLAGGLLDHPCGVGAAPLSKWVFVLADKLGKRNPYEDVFPKLLAEEASLIPLSLARKWLHIWELWKARLLLSVSALPPVVPGRNEKQEVQATRQ